MIFDPRNLVKKEKRDFYVGVDLGQKRDHTVVAIVEKKNRQLTLVHLKQFALKTEYDAIVEYLKQVGQKFTSVCGFWIDRTGVGEVFVENTIKHGLKNVQGIVLTLPEKQEVMTSLKQTMLEKRLHFPRDPDLENQMNDQIAEITTTGKTKFHHRTGMHDDKLWALGLAVYGARHDIEPYRPVGALGRRKDPLGRPRKPSWTDWLDKLKGETMQEKYDQSLTQVNLSARILRNDPRAILGVDPPPVIGLGDVGPSGVPKRVCMICGSTYVFDLEKDSPCGHTKKNGTVTP